MRPEPTGVSSAPALQAVGPTRKPGISRARRVEELRKGNANALKHGVFADVLNLPDVDREAALIFAARPALDPIRDRRLVEHLASAAVSRARALIAIERDGMTATLTSYERNLSGTCERLERAVHDRERERLAAARERPADLSAYRP